MVWWFSWARRPFWRNLRIYLIKLLYIAKTLQCLLDTNLIFGGLFFGLRLPIWTIEYKFYHVADWWFSWDTSPILKAINGYGYLIGCCYWCLSTWIYLQILFGYVIAGYYHWCFWCILYWWFSWIIPPFLTAWIWRFRMDDMVV